MLTYQLLRALGTRPRNGYPLIILVTDDVLEARRDRLRRDGAIVVKTTRIDPKWLVPANDGWKNVLNKLRAWESDRAVIMDLDVVLVRPLDGIFDDPAAAALAETRDPGNGSVPPPDTSSAYVFASMMEMNQVHATPPTTESGFWPDVDYLNAGLLVAQTSTEMLDTYLKTLEIPNIFDPAIPEHNLFNHVHDRNGAMPWKQVDLKWGFHHADYDDIKNGVHSLHEKWWSPDDQRVVPFTQGCKARMHAFQETRGLFLRQSDMTWEHVVCDLPKVSDYMTTGPIAAVIPSSSASTRVTSCS